MGNMPSSAARPEQPSFFEKGANRIGDIGGRPSEPKEATAVSPGPPFSKKSLTNLQLPNDIVDLLKIALEKLERQLKSEKTLHGQLNQMIEYHEIEGRSGKDKIVLAYVDKELMEDERFVRTFMPLGFIFNKKYKSLFVISNADAAQFGNDYQESVNQWQQHLSYEEVKLLLKDKIRLLEDSDTEVRFFRIQEMFGLEELTSRGGPLNEERSFDQVKLSQLLNDAFNDSELRDLCFDLQKYDLDYENLEGMAKNTKINELIGHFERRGFLQELVEHCKEKRPNSPWDEVFY